LQGHEGPGAGTHLHADVKGCVVKAPYQLDEHACWWHAWPGHACACTRVAPPELQQRPSATLALASVVLLPIACYAAGS
jgi:hypothetical protein